jgi:hypothetical protein
LYLAHNPDVESVVRRFNHIDPKVGG